MNKNQLFNHTQWQLAASYTLVMGLIVSLSAFSFYQVLTRFHLLHLDQELESVAGTLHDSIELKLKKPGNIEPIFQQLLPNICLVGKPCNPQKTLKERHILGATNQSDYYIRLFDNSQQPVAIGGAYPEGLPSTFNKKAWQTLQDAQGNRYHQISLSLHTYDNRDWGYLQVGRSLKYFDDYLNSMKLIFFLGLPLSMILIGGASWWLAGLAMQPIYRSYRQIQQFTADAAHELRTPLAASQATVESALRMPDVFNSEALDILQTTHRQNQRLIQLVTDLLLLARLDRQPVPIPQQQCCLNDIISDLVEELTAFAQSAEIELIPCVMLTYPLTVIGNEDQLYRLFSNLIVNAIKYTFAGGKVEVVLDRHDHHAVIQICDTGIGIAPQEQQRIFDRFYRVDSDRSRETGGSGLGLAIAAAIVKAHKGSLQVQSELGKGSIFTVQLALEIIR